MIAYTSFFIFLRIFDRVELIQDFPFNYSEGFSLNRQYSEAKNKSPTLLVITLEKVVDPEWSPILDVKLFALTC